MVAEEQLLAAAFRPLIPRSALMPTNNLASALSSNRAEELGFDVWDQFVIPSKLDINEWGNTQKPRVVVGGRGCGKTMLLRYLSHDSAFSPRRPNVNRSSLHHIGLYWRADTQFASLLDSREQPDDLWRAAFAHMSSLILGKEILGAFRSISTSNLGLIDSADLARIDFAPLSTSALPTPAQFDQLYDYLDHALHEFEQWGKRYSNSTPAAFLPRHTILASLDWRRTKPFSPTTRRPVLRLH